VNDYIEFSHKDAERLAKLFTVTILDKDGSVYITKQLENLDELAQILDLEALATDVLGVTDPLGQILAQLGDLLKSWASWITSTITGWMKDTGLFDAILGAWDYVQRIFSQLRDITNFLNNIWSWIQDVGKITVDSIFKAIETAKKFLTETIPQFLKQVIPQFESLVKFFSAIPEYISKALEVLSQLPSQVWSWIERLGSIALNAIETVRASIEGIITRITDIIKGIPGMVENAIEGIMGYIAKLRDYVSGLVTTISKYVDQAIKSLTNFGNMVQEFILSIRKGLEEFVEYIINLPKMAPDIAKQVGTWLWQNIAKPTYDFIVKNIVNPVVNAWNAFIQEATKRLFEIGSALQGFVNPLAQLWSWIKNVFEKGWMSLVDFFTKQLPSLAESIKNSLVTLGDVINKILTKPREFFVENIFKPTIETISTMAQTIARTAQAIASQIAQYLSNIGSIFWNAVTGFVETMKNTAKAFIDTIINAILSPVKSGLEQFFQALTEGYKELSEKVIKGEIKGEAPFLMGLITPLLVSGYVTYVVPVIVKGVGKAVGDQEVSIAPLGIGGKIRLKLGKIIESIAEAIERIPSKFLEGFLLGLGAWFMEPFRRPLYYWLGLRNAIPIEIPTISEGREIVRRWLPTPKWKEIVQYYQSWLALRGYSDQIIELYSKPVEVAFPQIREEDVKAGYVPITDRFGVIRKIPISLMYDIPTASEMCTMMVRDIFKSLDEFKKAIGMRGMIPDTAILYYYLHYKYPSPEKLWDFISRARACMLWFSIPESDIRAVAKELGKMGFTDQAIRAHTPKSPAQLNVVNPDIARLHVNAILTYMKWHDYAKWSWVSGYTSDNAIMNDLLADIPGRIDARWMWKWGVFSGIIKVHGEDFLRGLAPTLFNVPASWLERARAVPEKEGFDSLMLARVAIARGVHPEWIPFISVAECMNALSEERTLLRTGLMNLYKEGFWTFNVLTNIMKGFFTVSFTVLKWNPNSYMFEPVVIKIPVKYLEGERKLLTLRAIMDRALDILRDAHREVVYAIRENIYPLDKYENLIGAFIGIVNEKFFVKEIATIMGIQPEQAPRLVLDKGYIEAYKGIIKIYQEIYTIRRVRYWLSRLMWNVYSRLMRGYITLAETKQIITKIVEIARLTDTEKGVLEFLAINMYALAKREILARAIIRAYARRAITEAKALEMLKALGLEETIAKALIDAEVRVYIPTVSQIATLAEYVPEATQLLPEVFELRGVPEHHKPIWEKYIFIRQVIDEVRRLVTTYRYLFSLGGLNLKQLDEMLKELKNYGYIDKELELIKLDFLNRRHIQVLIRAVPSLYALTYLYSFSNLAKDILMSRLKEIINEAPIARETKQKLLKMWDEVSENRVCYADVRAYISELVESYASGIIDDAYLERELRWLKNFGIKDRQIELIRRRAKLRRSRYAVIYGGPYSRSR